MSSARQGILRLARAIGLEDSVRRVQRMLEPEVVSRDRRDNATATLAMALVLRTDDSTVDVGAHGGGFLQSIVRFAPAGRHVAYEPLPGLARRLRECFPGVEVRESAVSDTAGTCRFFIHQEVARSGLFRSGPKSAEEIVVRTARLDDDLPGDFAPSFVKIDVEGAEALVLRGAQRLLAAHHPYVLFEHGLSSRENGIPSTDVWDLLVPLGYRIFDLDGRTYDLPGFLAAPVWNFLAVPDRPRPGSP